MKMSPEELSEMARKNNQKMIETGTHPLQKRIDGTSHVTDRIKNGTWHMSRRPDGTSLASDRVKNGTHPLASYLGSKHFNFNHTLYTFENLNSGERVTLTMYEFTKTYSLDRSHVYCLVKRTRKTHKGWKLFIDSSETE